jgi:formate hydrogenlyase transcriptional activator
MRLVERELVAQHPPLGQVPVASVEQRDCGSPSESGTTFVPRRPADLPGAIIGQSAGLSALLRGVETVAPTDSTVLILGETGTGKELVARAIHNLSSRRDRAFVRTSCASIPGGLLESELFGRERGAYTGAVTREIGRIELANGGTLFLDEIGEIPLELQSKLLSVLQQQEFERLGSARTIQVDFRLVAATNRDLSHMVKEGRFRSDLYYRLNVFPLTVPPLRSRANDIPILVWHFVKKYAARMNRRIDTILPQDIAAMAEYPWPGNVRELQNFVERSVILSLGTILCPPLQELKATAKSPGRQVRTLADAEREVIHDALRSTDWVIGGQDGAAARLGVKRTTLLYKMRRLGIARPKPHEAR